VSFSASSDPLQEGLSGGCEEDDEDEDEDDEDEEDEDEDEDEDDEEEEEGDEGESVRASRLPGVVSALCLWTRKIRRGLPFPRLGT
jgi:hypothetical protein